MEGEEAGGDSELHTLGRKQGRFGERERENGSEGVKVEDSKFGGFFYIYLWHVVPSQGVWT